MKLKLPKDFFMGAAMSGPQTEGAYKKDGKLENIWDTWSDSAISDFYNKVGSYVGNNFYENCMKIQLMNLVPLQIRLRGLCWKA